jgi:outer membrane protein
MKTCTILALLAVIAGAEHALWAQTQATPPPVPAPPVVAGAPKAFPGDFKVGYINPDRIISDSKLGKESSAKMAGLRAQKMTELNARNQEIEVARQKVAMGTLLTDQARAAAQKNIDRLQIELQRAQQDADAAVQEFQQQLNAEFDRRLSPVIEQIGHDRGIYLLLRVDTGAIAWADPAIDLTADVVKRLDATTSPAAAKPPK